MTLFPVFMDVYHKKKLVTKEEAEKVTSTECMMGLDWKSNWADVAVTKDPSTAARIADILAKHSVVRHIRGKCVYSRLCVLILYRIPLERHNNLEFFRCMLHSCISYVCELIDGTVDVLVIRYIRMLLLACNCSSEYNASVHTYLCDSVSQIYWTYVHTCYVI